MNKKYDFQNHHPMHGSNPLSLCFGMTPFPNLSLKPTFHHLSCGDLYRDAPESILLRAVDSWFFCHLRPIIKSLLEEVYDMIDTAAGGDSEIIDIKVKSMSEQELLEWTRDTRCNIRDWFKVMGQSDEMAGAIKKLKTTVMGQKRKRDAQEAGEGRQEDDTSGGHKKHKSTNIKDGDHLMTVANNDSGRDVTCASAGVGVNRAVTGLTLPKQDGRLTKAGVLSLPWPRSGQPIPEDVRIYTGRKFKALGVQHGDYKRRVPAPSSYVSAKVMDLLKTTWMDVVGRDPCECRTCRRQRAEDDAAALAQEQEETAKRRKAKADAIAAWHNAQKATPQKRNQGPTIKNRPANPPKVEEKQKPMEKQAKPTWEAVPAQVEANMEEYWDPNLDEDELAEYDPEDLALTSDDESNEWEENLNVKITDFGSQEV